MLLSLPTTNLCGHRPHLRCRTYAPWMTSKVERELLTAWGLRGGTVAKADEVSGVKKRGPPTLSAAERGGVIPQISNASEETLAKLCDSGLPDMEVCDFVLAPSVQRDIFQEAWSRGRWLLGLLVLQSMSSVVLEHYEQLIKDHLVVTLFLTMLVGAGGNAGNQSAIKVIRGLATKSISLTPSSVSKTMLQQGAIGLLLGLGLACGGFVRVYLTNGSLLNSVAISLSLFTIVMTSVLTGTALPFALAKSGVDPANGGTVIQVLMDIWGVLVTCLTCHTILDVLAKGTA